MTRRRIGGAILTLVSVVAPLVVGMLDLRIDAFLGRILLVACGLALLVGISLWLWPSSPNKDEARNLLGGTGGEARASGRGLAIGGPGGAAGPYGSGGRGGDAHAFGEGIAVGGEGGHGDGRGGRSGAEVLGVPNERMPDGSWLWDYGRGGNSYPVVRKRDVNLSEAIAFALFRQWGRRFFEAAAEPNAVINPFVEQVRQLARDGELNIWGKGMAFMSAFLRSTGVITIWIGSVS